MLQKRAGDVANLEQSHDRLAKDGPRHSADLHLSATVSVLYIELSSNDLIGCRVAPF